MTTFQAQEAAGYVAVDFCTLNGIGARLAWCLEVLAYCDDHGLAADFRFSWPWLPERDFFEPNFLVPPIAAATGPRSFVRVDNIDDAPHTKVSSLARGSELALKYIQPQPNVAAEVDDFWNQHGLVGRVLGVHYRGTDKIAEAPRVEYETMALNITDYLVAYPDTTAVFVSSDEEEFIRYATARFPDIRIVFRTDSRRSLNGTETYRDADLVLPIQRDAVVNMLLLARCSSLIKTASFLSSFSALLNPEMETFLLNSPYDDTLWFPERQMLERQEAENVSHQLQRLSELQSRLAQSSGNDDVIERLAALEHRLAAPDEQAASIPRAHTIGSTAHAHRRQRD